MYKNIILHVPHSSADFSFAGAAEVKLFGQKWLEQASDLIDWFTDELFVPQSHSDNILPVVFDVCRTLCDVERLSHDPLEKRGLGITACCCLMTDRGAYNPRLFPSGDIRIMQKYLDHQYKLASLLVQRHESLLLDCHSFSNGATLLQPDISMNHGIDVCLGWNNDFTRPKDEVLSLVTNYFKAKGYSVGLNTPYSNAKTVDTPADYNALMIELNKRIYMDEKNIAKNDRFEQVASDVQGLYELLLK
ncbi:MAG: N-formylglutamate amidohydrolase [Bacteroidales bacterium]|nr:N-formylglutamate amidohydrolase [Bacteroidales bacterium]